MIDVETRFWRRVVKGPGARDCWIWTGAIADDAYGRFWLGDGKVVRPHRLVYELVTGTPLGPTDIIEHAVCDNPICVRFTGAAVAGVPGGDHLLKSNQGANLARMGQRRRGGGDPFQYRFRSTDRASLYARSLRLRDAVKDGWDEQRIRDALALPEDQQPPLFAWSPADS